jgi:hypothetical protein
MILVFIKPATIQINIQKKEKLNKSVFIWWNENEFNYEWMNNLIKEHEKLLFFSFFFYFI